MKEWRLNGVTTQPARPTGPTLDPFASHGPPRALVDQLPATLWTTDSVLRFTSFVGRGAADLGLGPNQIVGTPLPRLFETASAAMDAVSAHRRALHGDTVPMWLTWGSQSLRALVGPLRDASREIIGTIGVALELRGTASRAGGRPVWPALAGAAPVA